MRVVPRSSKSEAEYQAQIPSASTRLIIFDFETTGLHVDSNEIIEIGAVEVTQGKVTRKFHSFACPSIVISASATGVHGWTNDNLRGYPSSIEQLRKFLVWIGSFMNTCLVAHNLRFDLKFLEAGIEILNIMQAKQFYYPEATFCTYNFIRRNFRRVHNLRQACKVFATTPVQTDEFHGAIVDAELTWELYRALANWKFHVGTPGIAQVPFARNKKARPKYRTLPWNNLDSQDRYSGSDESLDLIELYPVPSDTNN